MTKVTISTCHLGNDKITLRTIISDKSLSKRHVTFKTTCQFLNDKNNFQNDRNDMSLSKRQKQFSRIQELAEMTKIDKIIFAEFQKQQKRHVIFNLTKSFLKLTISTCQL